MKIPSGMNEEQVLATINKIASKLAYTFIFPPYTYEDVKQEAIIEAIQGLDNYSDRFPLENFLWVHVRRRLCNFKRKNYMRLNKPCMTCPFKAWIKKGDICTKYKDKNDCELYVAWSEITERKKNIISPISMENECSSENDIATQLSHKEMVDLLDKNIPLEFRPLFLQLKAGVKLTRNQMAQLRAQIEIILQENNIDVDQYF
jgi:hypothetical protein